MSACYSTQEAVFWLPHLLFIFGKSRAQSAAHARPRERDRRETHRCESPDAAKRFIEVKGRAQTGGVMLTAPEVDKLRQLGDRAFLYIVTFCKGEKPKLRIIQDPMANLHPAMLYRQV